MTALQITGITGHTPKSVEMILDRYLVRSSALAEAGQAKRLAWGEGEVTMVITSLRYRCQQWLVNAGFARVPSMVNSLTKFVESELARCPACKGLGFGASMEVQSPPNYAEWGDKVDACPHCRGTGKRQE